MPWISLVLISLPSRPTIPHFCAMWITRSGTIVIWGKWDVQSPTLPLYSYHSRPNACGLPKWTIPPFATELPCHLPFLFSCMWLCLCNSIAILKLIVLSKCDLLSNGSMTIALIATCTIYICESQVACISYSFTYRNFLSLVSFASDFCTAGHFS